MNLPQGKIIYSGPSLIDSQPIAAIAIPSGWNRKVGWAHQTYIIRSDISPVEAVKSREDYSICGNCIHRGKDSKSRSCYVATFQSPTQVYKSFKEGKYKEAAPEKLDKTLFVRLGAYGDPAAVPRIVWEKLVYKAPGWSGYTHSPQVQDLKDLVQASADTEAHALQLQSDGWKTFRTRLPGQPLMKGEVQCPASNETQHATTCAQCKLCNGQKKNVSLEIHGAVHTRRNFVLNLERQ